MLFPIIQSCGRSKEKRPIDMVPVASSSSQFFLSTDSCAVVLLCAGVSPVRLFQRWKSAVSRIRRQQPLAFCQLLCLCCRYRRTRSEAWLRTIECCVFSFLVLISFFVLDSCREVTDRISENARSFRFVLRIVRTRHNRLLSKIPSLAVYHTFSWRQCSCFIFRG